MSKFADEMRGLQTEAEVRIEANMETSSRAFHDMLRKEIKVAANAGLGGDVFMVQVSHLQPNQTVVLMPKLICKLKDDGFRVYEKTSERKRSVVGSIDLVIGWDPSFTVNPNAHPPIDD